MHDDVDSDAGERPVGDEQAAGPESLDGQPVRRRAMAGEHAPRWYVSSNTKPTNYTWWMRGINYRRKDAITATAALTMAGALDYCALATQPDNYGDGYTWDEFHRDSLKRCTGHTNSRSRKATEPEQAPDYAPTDYRAVRAALREKAYANTVYDEAGHAHSLLNAKSDKPHLTDKCSGVHGYVRNLLWERAKRGGVELPSGIGLTRDCGDKRCVAPEHHREVPRKNAKRPEVLPVDGAYLKAVAEHARDEGLHFDVAELDRFAESYTSTLALMFKGINRQWQWLALLGVSREEHGAMLRAALEGCDLWPILRRTMEADDALTYLPRKAEALAASFPDVAALYRSLHETAWAAAERLHASMHHWYAEHARELVTITDEFAKVAENRGIPFADEPPGGAEFKPPRPDAA